MINQAPPALQIKTKDLENQGYTTIDREEKKAIYLLKFPLLLSKSKFKDAVWFKDLLFISGNKNDYICVLLYIEALLSV